MACAICKSNEPYAENSSYCKTCNSLRTIRKQHVFKFAQLEYFALREKTKVGECLSCAGIFHPAQLGIHTPPGVPYQKASHSTGTVPFKPEVIEYLDNRLLFCLNCLREKRGTGCSKLKKQALDYLGGACSRCGTCNPPGALEFHHTDRSLKKLQIGDRGLKEWAQITTELDTCVILCANCHSLEHFEEKQELRNNWIEKYNIDPERYIIYPDKKGKE